MWISWRTKRAESLVPFRKDFSFFTTWKLPSSADWDPMTMISKDSRNGSKNSGKNKKHPPDEEHLISSKPIKAANKMTFSLKNVLFTVSDQLMLHGPWDAAISAMIFFFNLINNFKKMLELEMSEVFWIDSPNLDSYYTPPTRKIACTRQFATINKKNTLKIGVKIESRI